MNRNPISHSEARTLIARLASLGVEPGGVADDSRRVRPGDLFLAYPGAHADGRQFIADARVRGASAVLWESGDGFVWNSEWQLPNLPATGLRAMCGTLAQIVFGNPSERLSLIAVTGTNGKTTISHWISSVHPRRCAVIGTLGAALDGQNTDFGLTTPQATALTRHLAEFADAGAQACAVEASSIGIEEGRLDGTRVDVAVFSNLTRDHLDYHGSMERYAAAKARLFDWPRLRLAVINLDDPFGHELVRMTSAMRTIGYTLDAGQAREGFEFPAFVRAENLQETITGLRFILDTPKGRAPVETGLLGRYNASNLLAVAAVLIDAGLTPTEVAERLSGLQPPPGRLEKLGGDNEPLVVVDYAHTPDALENALKALRGVARARGARLIAIFGCGGDRDRGKRPLMGRIATELADRVILTSDNPRTEDPLVILDEIRSGAPDAEMLPDRSEAILKTVCTAHPADVILLAGKGHEPYQEIGGVRHPFSDLTKAGEALSVRRQASP